MDDKEDFIRRMNSLDDESRMHFKDIIETLVRCYGPHKDGRALVLFVGDDSPAACAMTLNCDDMEAYNLIQDVHNYFHFLNIKDAPAKERFN